MMISVQNKKRHCIRGRHRDRAASRTVLDGLNPTARANHVRWFDPTVGRWLSEDPLGLGPNSNPYRYCDNGPTDGTDPSGLADAGKSPLDGIPNGLLQPDPGWLTPVPVTPGGGQEVYVPESMRWPWLTNNTVRFAYKLTCAPGRKPGGHWGGYDVEVGWQVSPAPLKPPSGSKLPEKCWIIQHVTASFNVRDAKTKAKVTFTSADGQIVDDGHWNYWEAWPVPLGSSHPSDAGDVGTEHAGRPINDIFRMTNGQKRTCGTIVETGTAQFYPYTELPKAFQRGGVVHAGALWSTEDPSAMAGLLARSNLVTHTVTATWTTEKNGQTKVESKIE